MQPMPLPKNLFPTPWRVRFQAGDREALHVHEHEGQLKWPGAVALVRTARGIFVLPPQLAIWIPRDELHGGIYPQETLERSLYLDPDECRRMPAHSCAVRLSDALRASLLDDKPIALPVHVCDIGLAPVPLVLPRTSRVQPVIEALWERPQLDRPLTVWAQLLDMSPRSLNRAFHQATGLSLGAWRKRVRLLYALQRLAAGAHVSQIARELAYRPSAFAHTFRSILGTTPSGYYQNS